MTIASSEEMRRHAAPINDDHDNFQCVFLFVRSGLCSTGKECKLQIVPNDCRFNVGTYAWISNCFPFSAPEDLEWLAFIDIRREEET